MIKLIFLIVLLLAGLAGIGRLVQKRRDRHNHKAKKAFRNIKKMLLELSPESKPVLHEWEKTFKSLLKQRRRVEDVKQLESDLGRTPDNTMEAYIEEEIGILLAALTDIWKNAADQKHASSYIKHELEHLEELTQIMKKEYRT